MLTRIDYACCTIRLLDAFTPSKMSSQMEMMIYNVCCGSQPSPWERKQKVPGLCISLLCVLCIGSSCFLSLENSGIIRETSGWSPVRKKHFFYIEVQLGPLSRIWPFILHIIASPLVCCPSNDMYRQRRWPADFSSHLQSPIAYSEPQYAEVEVTLPIYEAC